MDLDELGHLLHSLIDHLDLPNRQTATELHARADRAVPKEETPKEETPKEETPVEEIRGVATPATPAWQVQNQPPTSPS